MSPMARSTPPTFTAQAGHWFVLVAHESGFPTILTVEPDQQQALAWREELVRRLVHTPTMGSILTDHTGRVFLAPAQGGMASRLTVGSPFTGPREILVLRVETTMPALPQTDSPLHRVLVGRFPA